MKIVVKKKTLMGLEKFEDRSEEEDSEGVRDFGYEKQVLLFFDMRDHVCSQV